ncbi:unnamed protein product [Adineta ricciae]|uniref:F-box domain-containing protein n=1 Tax=Adineta ricciae TaxID=249248 RepID=A0A814P8R1_ADIRI|nr:unnamed protein product [Adineta ricciae]CAF1109845.1 unnamed protein product [Adineta ricciae]
MVTFNELPNEILLMICKELNDIDILYSLRNVNERFNQIIHNLLLINRLTFVQRTYFHFVDLISSDEILYQFTSNILPQIADQIEWIDLESSRMEDILRATNYNNLHGLGLYNINEISAKYLLSEANVCCGRLKNSIRKLVMTFSNEFETSYEIFLFMSNLVNEIFNILPGLTTLVFSEVKYQNCFRLDFSESPLNCFTSPILQKLIVHVENFDDCLYLLDGRFPQLETMHVDLITIRPPKHVRSEGFLPYLKRFALSCRWLTYDYDETIPPLLRRMLNLTKLNLCLTLGLFSQKIVDGNIIRRDIISQLPKLKKFDFFIHSITFKQNEDTISSIDDIQRTFIGFEKSSVR